MRGKTEEGWEDERGGRMRGETEEGWEQRMERGKEVRMMNALSIEGRE